MSLTLTVGAILESEKKTRLEPVVSVLKTMSDDERLAVFSEFCTACGSDNPKCHCTKDE